MPFQIEITPSALAELKAVKAYHQRQIAAAIDSQLRHEPLIQTRNRKPIIGVEPDFDHVPPIWELRVGDYRVYYDVGAAQTLVSIRAIREKPPHTVTEDSL